MTYRTNSLPIASYLCSLKTIEFEGIDESNPESIYFLFTPKEEVKDFANKYLFGKAVVDPQLRWKNYEKLRDIVFEIKGRKR